MTRLLEIVLFDKTSGKRFQIAEVIPIYIFMMYDTNACFMQPDMDEETRAFLSFDSLLA